MTQHVRTGYRRHRKAAWMLFSGTVLFAAVGLAIVIPAVGAPSALQAAQPSGVVPTVVNTGGSNFSCTTSTGGAGPAGMSTFQVVNPPQSQAAVTYDSANTASTSTPLPPGVTFTLRGLNGPDKGKFFAFRASTGVTVFHVAVKGGNDQAWYNYVSRGGVTADGAIPSDAAPSNTTGLHSTMGSNGFNVASIATFCWARTTTISGRVYLDNDGNGSFTSSTPPDAGQNGWTVRLFNTSSSPAVQVGSALTTASPSTDPAGSYTFTGVPIGANYKVCVQPPANSGNWDQTAPSGTNCSTPALPAGRAGSDLTPLQSPAPGQDFGVQKTIAANCVQEFGPDALAGSQIVDYKAQLTNPNGGSECKDAVVMYSYLDGSVPYAIIHPTASAGTDPFWVVERIRMKVPGGAQNPVTLKYDDTKPYGDTYKTMKMCLSDPRADDEFALAVDPASINVMPSGGETSCMIESTDFPSGNTYNYEGYIATDVDGIKTPS